MPRRLTTEEFIAKARVVHGDKYNYSKTVYENSKQKLVITCPKHGDFEQEPSSHLSGYGCLDCARERNIESCKSNTEEFIAKARKVWGDRYDYSEVEYKDNRTKVIIICPEHGPFPQRPYEHLRGTGCPHCSGAKKSNTEEFIAKAKKVWGDRYDYSEVDYKNSYTHVTIICPEHGQFPQTPHSHLRGTGCPHCAKELRKSNTEEFIAKAKKVWRDRYDYSEVDYKDNKTDVIIICPEHGRFSQRPQNHLTGNGCPHCAKELCKSNTEEFIAKAKKVWGDRYDYSEVDYKNNNTKVIIICPEHGRFSQRPANHLGGQGCPYCHGEFRSNPGTLYYLSFTNKTTGYKHLKIGIAYDIDRRIKEHQNKTWQKEKLGYLFDVKVLEVVNYGTYKEAELAERYLIRHLKAAGHLPIIFPNSKTKEHYHWEALPVARALILERGLKHGKRKKTEAIEQFCFSFAAAVS